MRSPVQPPLPCIGDTPVPRLGRLLRPVLLVHAEDRDPLGEEGDRGGGEGGDGRRKVREGGCVEEGLGQGDAGEGKEGSLGTMLGGSGEEI